MFANAGVGFRYEKIWDDHLVRKGQEGSENAVTYLFAQNLYQPFHEKKFDSVSESERLKLTKSDSFTVAKERK